MHHPFSLEGKVVILTGASKGIGESMALAMAQAGARVVVSSRKRDAVEEVAEGIRRGGGEALAVECHVGKAEQRQALIEQAVAAFGRVDVLVNNAATNPVFGPSLAVDEAAFDKIMEVNVKAPFELAKLAHPHLVESRGSVVNISSIGGVSPEPGLGIYSVSKAALVSLTRVLAKEWGPDVRVNAICPGLVKTKFSQALWADEEIAKLAVGTQPIPRVAEPDEIAGMAVFLASAAASYVTGGVFLVDGGHTI